VFVQAHALPPNAFGIPYVERSFVQTIKAGWHRLQPTVFGQLLHGKQQAMIGPHIVGC
jgi:hypothetical protein